MLSKSLWKMVLLVFLSVSIMACDEPKKPVSVTVQLNWKHGVDFIGYYIAKSRGLYAQEQLNVTVRELSDFTKSDNIFDEVGKGTLDYSAAGLSLMNAQARGVPVTAIANINKYAPGAYFAREELGIRNPSDLAGKSIVVKNDTWLEVLEKVLAAVGLTTDDVTMVKGGYDMTPFLEGEVDVWTGFINDDPVRARLTGLNIKTIPLYEYGIVTPALTIFTSTESLLADPEKSERFIRATIRGWQWAVENPTAAVDTMLALYPEMAKDREFHLASFDATIPLIRLPGIELGSIDCKGWLSEKTLAGMQNTKNICTEKIFNKAMSGS